MNLTLSQSPYQPFFFSQRSSRYTFLFGTDSYGLQEPRLLQMVRGCYGFHIIAVENGRFRRNSVCCGPVYGPWLSLRFGYGPVYDSRLSLRVGSGPVCTQHISSRTATSPMPSTLGMHSPLRQRFYISTSTVSPAAASCSDCTSWRHWLRLSCCAAMTALYF